MAAQVLGSVLIFSMGLCSRCGPLAGQGGGVRYDYHNCGECAMIMVLALLLASCVLCITPKIWYKPVVRFANLTPMRCGEFEFEVAKV